MPVGTMNELTKSQEAMLAECFEAMDAGVPIEACLARHPQHASTLRPYLELRSEMLSAEHPEPSAAAYDAGWLALLDRLHDARAQEKAGMLANVFGLRWGKSTPSAKPSVGGFRWKMFGNVASPLARAAVAVGVLALVGASALGVSAAAGFGPARAALSTLRIIDDHAEADENVSPPASRPDDRREGDGSDRDDIEQPADGRAGDDTNADQTGTGDSGSQPPTDGGQEQDTTQLLPDVTDVTDLVKPTPTLRPVDILPKPDDIVPTPVPSRLDDLACDTLTNTFDLRTCRTKQDAPADQSQPLGSKLLPVP